VIHHWPGGVIPAVNAGQSCGNRKNGVFNGDSTGRRQGAGQPAVPSFIMNGCPHLIRQALNHNVLYNSILQNFTT
jgi:hypothetical protein